MSSESVLVDPFGDDDADEFASSFVPKPAPKPEAKAKPTTSTVKAADKVAAKQGFTGRKAPQKPKMRRSDSFRTGRNAHVGVKARAEDKDRLAAISDDREWVNGQTLQYALDALEEKIANPEDPFWQTRNFHGVE